MPVERSAGIIIYRDTQEGRKYLLLRASRDEATLAPGRRVKDFWDFPKGRLEKGETGLEAACREAEEEAGLDDIEIHLDFKHTVQYFTFRTGIPVPKYVAMFLGRVASDAVTLSWEHDECSWLSYEDAKNRITIPKMKNALEEAEKFLEEAKS
ncbi:MAG: NUDIX domain-containing protein [Patescibacteria group bacterium]